jgi:fatty acid desaturase
MTTAGWSSSPSFSTLTPSFVSGACPVVSTSLSTVAHYTANKWTFARGALATIDRTFLGPIGAYVLHGICETHVAHHISSKMPHCALPLSTNMRISC